MELGRKRQYALMQGGDEDDDDLEDAPPPELMGGALPALRDCRLDIRMRPQQVPYPYVFFGRPCLMDVRLLGPEGQLVPHNSNIEVAVLDENNQALSANQPGLPITAEFATMPHLSEATGQLRLTIGEGPAALPMPYPGQRIKVRVSTQPGPGALEYAQLESVSEELLMCRAALHITHAPPKLWYKDEGGKTNCIEIVVQVRGCQQEQALPKVPLTVVLLYEDNNKKVYNQEILQVQADTQLVTDREGKAVLKFRIKEVSQRHQGQKFKIKIAADTRAAPSQKGIAPVLTAPIMVLSKRKNKHKLRAAAQAAAEAAAAARGEGAPDMEDSDSDGAAGIPPPPQPQRARANPPARSAPPGASFGAPFGPPPSAATWEPPRGAPQASISSKEPPPASPAYGVPSAVPAQSPANAERSPPTVAPLGPLLHHAAPPPPGPFRQGGQAVGADPPHAAPIMHSPRGGPLSEVADWTHSVVELLRGLQWQHIGFQTDDQGQMDVGRPLWRCPVCKVCKDMTTPDIPHGQACPLSSVLELHSSQILGCLQALGDQAPTGGAGGSMANGARSPGPSGHPWSPTDASLRGASQPPSRDSSLLNFGAFRGSSLTRGSTLDQLALAAVMEHVPPGQGMPQYDHMPMMLRGDSSGSAGLYSSLDLREDSLLRGGSTGQYFSTSPRSEPHPLDSSRHSPPLESTPSSGSTNGLDSLVNHARALRAVDRSRSLAPFLPAESSGENEVGVFYIMACEAPGDDSSGTKEGHLPAFDQAGKLKGFYTEKWDGQQMHLLFSLASVAEMADPADPSQCPPEEARQLEDNLAKALRERASTRSGTRAAQHNVYRLSSYDGSLPSMKQSMFLERWQANAVDIRDSFRDPS